MNFVQRAGLLESLAQFQSTPQEQALMTSLTSVQTKGVKRSLAEVEKISQLPEVSSNGSCTESNSGKRRSKWREEQQEEEKQPSSDDNVIGLNVVEESSSSDEDEGNSEPPEKPEKEIPELPKPQPTPVVEIKAPEAPPVKRESKPAVFVPVHRTPETQAGRMKLPIIAEEQSIVEAIHDHPVVILAGETGSGKTTQVFFVFGNVFEFTVYLIFHL